eukprot:scaffold196070_cov22-Tisochrysis_lutea.AAC.1
MSGETRCFLLILNVCILPCTCPKSKLHPPTSCKKGLDAIQGSVSDTRRSCLTISLMRSSWLMEACGCTQRTCTRVCLQTFTEGTGEQSCETSSLMRFSWLVYA